MVAAPSEHSSSAPRVRFGAFLWLNHASWEELRSAARDAEAAGFDTLWISDHLIAPSGDPEAPVFEAWTTLAGLAAVTSHLRLGLLVGNNLLRHPAVVAKMAVTVDHISGGRIILGLGSGWYEPEATMHGLPFEDSPGDRIDRLEEATRIVMGLAGGEQVHQVGRFYAVRDARHAPASIQGRIPLLIGGSGRQRTLALVARHADVWHADGDAQALSELDDALRRHCEVAGRDPSTIERMAHRWIRLRDDAAEARRVLEGDLDRHGITAPHPWLPLTGTPSEVAKELRPLVASGFHHILMSLAAPFDRGTFHRLDALRDALDRWT